MTLSESGAVMLGLVEFGIRLSAPCDIAARANTRYSNNSNYTTDSANDAYEIHGVKLSLNLREH